jgi:hypothetical protein
MRFIHYIIRFMGLTGPNMRNTWRNRNRWCI